PYTTLFRSSDNETIRTENLSLAPGEKWQNTISFVPKVATPEEKVEFLLFIDGQSEPYRKLHLWLNVKSSTP
ncbi:MAG: DUF1616 domain-containing protein, partial [Dehalococcoidales bacterium]|nr:DUF1616 domain-containing protein [Dehalococcoidales bacterium]